VQELKRKVHREAKACEVCEVTTTVNSQQCLQKPFVTPSVSQPVLPPVSVLSDISSTLSSFSPTLFLSLSLCVCVFRQQHQNEQLGHGAAEGVGVKNAILRGGAGSLRGAVRWKDEVRPWESAGRHAEAAGETAVKTAKTIKQARHKTAKTTVKSDDVSEHDKQTDRSFGGLYQAATVSDNEATLSFTCHALCC
jgi:hypothetical protein